MDFCIASQRAEVRDFLKEVDSKLSAFIKKHNEPSFSGKGSTDKYVRIKVKAIPLTKEENTKIVEYLNAKYLKHVAGSYFYIKKCLFSRRYLIATGCVDCGEFW